MKTHLFGCVVLAVCMAGCQQNKEPVVLLRPSLEWHEVGAEGLPAEESGIVNLSPAGTDGVFPASIAVVRLTVVDGVLDGGRMTVLDMEPANDMLPWNSLFDNLRYVADAFPLNDRDLNGANPAPAQLCRAAHDLSANLCLVYAASDPSVWQSRIRGVIYDTRTQTALAAIQANADGSDPEFVEHPAELADDDMSHCDARVLASRRFEQLVYDCVRDLQRADRVVAPSLEEGWTPDGPVLPRAWPPLPSNR